MTLKDSKYAVVKLIPQSTSQLSNFGSGTQPQARLYLPKEYIFKYRSWIHHFI